MIRVLFLISVMSSGGAARVLSVLANQISRREDACVSIVTHIQGGGYELGGDVKWGALFSPNEVRASIWNKIWRRIVYWPRLFRAISGNRPDVVVVFLRGMNWRAIFVCRFLGIPVVATEHTNHEAERGFWSWVERRLIYKLADRLVVLTEFDREYYSRYLSQVLMIPNPLSFPPVPRAARRERVILAVGDLDRWHIKGFDVLIQIFSELAGDYPEWRLRIVGPGKQGREAVRRMISGSGLEARVELPGFIGNVDEIMRNSEIFVLTSRYEGFSMALLEAMSQGCACVSFNCKSGPGDLIVSGKNGLLVPDQDERAMKEALRHLIENESVRNYLADGAVRSSGAYMPSILESKWLCMLREVVWRND